MLDYYELIYEEGSTKLFFAEDIKFRDVRKIETLLDLILKNTKKLYEIETVQDFEETFLEESFFKRAIDYSRNHLNQLAAILGLDIENLDNECCFNFFIYDFEEEMCALNALILVKFDGEEEEEMPEFDPKRSTGDYRLDLEINLRRVLGESFGGVLDHSLRDLIKMNRVLSYLAELEAKQFEGDGESKGEDKIMSIAASAERIKPLEKKPTLDRKIKKEIEKMGIKLPNA